MKGIVVVTVLAALASGALGGAVRGAPGSSPRQARWFLSRADVTEVVEEEKMVTQVTPWSCVVVAPSLPPCRHVRQLDIMATPPTPISATAAPVLPRFYGDNSLVEAARRRYYLDQASPLDASYYNDMVPVPAAPQGGWVPLMAREATDPLPAAPAAPVATPSAAAAPAQAAAPAPAAASAPAAPAVPDKKKEQGWAEWLGLRAHTITSTLVRYATTKVVDPDTVVTFSVRGCQPSKLPFDLPLCVAQQQLHTPVESSAPAVEVSPAAPPAAAPAAPAPGDSKPVPAETKPAPAEQPTPAPETAPLAVSSMAPIVAADKPAEPAVAASTAEQEAPAATP